MARQQQKSKPDQADISNSRSAINGNSLRANREIMGGHREISLALGGETHCRECAIEFWQYSGRSLAPLCHNLPSMRVSV
jgi:hypothetical protein